MSRGKTGGNMEPMPFVRRWGASANDDDAEDPTRVHPNGSESTSDVSPPKKHRHRDRSRSPKRDKRRSRSPDKKRHKKRSRSREGRSKRRRSRSRDDGRDRGVFLYFFLKRFFNCLCVPGIENITYFYILDDRSRDDGLSAFPPPPDYLQQVQQRQQEIEMQIMQQQMQQSMKQEVSDYGQTWQEEQQKQSAGGDALSAALAAAAMVAQKLKKTHGAPVSTELIAKIPPKQTGYADTVLSKDQFDGKKAGQTESDEQREKRRKSRWSNTKAFVPGMPTILPADIDDNQRQIYLLQMDVEETTRRLRQCDFGQNLDPSERSLMDIFLGLKGGDCINFNLYI
ncbi:unnamed protein product [Meloidogyne enterolobii]|uniref:Uncharacterized protein n=1 Tax=Meloidogyne enterolobii TaxID=390850 RepID=A0ACB0YFI7_MELEN